MHTASDSTHRSGNATRCANPTPSVCRGHRARKSRTTLQNKVRLQVLPEQLTLFVNTSVTFKQENVLIILKISTFIHPVFED